MIAAAEVSTGACVKGPTTSWGASLNADNFPHLPQPYSAVAACNLATCAPGRYVPVRWTVPCLFEV